MGVLFDYPESLVRSKAWWVTGPTVSGKTACARQLQYLANQPQPYDHGLERLDLSGV